MINLMLPLQIRLELHHKNQLTESSYSDKNRTASNKCIISVVKRFLNTEAVLFPEFYDLYLSKTVVSYNDTKMDKNDAQSSNCPR